MNIDLQPTGSYDLSDNPYRHYILITLTNEEAEYLKLHGLVGLLTRAEKVSSENPVTISGDSSYVKPAKRNCNETDKQKN